MLEKKLLSEKLSNKKASLKYSLALVALLSFGEAKADFATNLITNPAYSYFPGNIYHDILWGDDDLAKNPKLKRTFEASLKILRKYFSCDEKKLKDINREYLKLFSKVYKDKNYSTLKLIDEFLKLSSGYGLSYSDSLNLFLEYYKKHFLPDNFSGNLKKEIKYSLDFFLKTYSNKELSQKLKLLLDYYKAGNLDKETIDSIFPELKKEKEALERYLLYMLIFTIIFWGAGYAYIEYKFRKS